MHTKPQQRLIDSMRSTGQLIHHIGGGWRMFDGTPVNWRTVESLAKRGELSPAGNDLLDDEVLAYRLNTH